MPAKNSEKTLIKMKTRSRLEPNGTINPINELRVRVNENKLNNSIPVNDQPNINIEDILETVFLEPITNEANKIPQMKQRPQEGKITADEYNDQLSNLKDRLKENVNKMNLMRDNIKAQNKKVENESINSSTAIKYSDNKNSTNDAKIVARNDDDGRYETEREIVLTGLLANCCKYPVISEYSSEGKIDFMKMALNNKSGKHENSDCRDDDPIYSSKIVHTYKKVKGFDGSENYFSKEIVHSIRFLLTMTIWR